MTWQPDIFAGAWPAWVQVLASGFDSGFTPLLDKRGMPYKCRAQHIRHIRCFLDDETGEKTKQYAHCHVTNTVRAMVQKPGLAKAWYESSEKFAYPNLVGISSVVNPLHLTTDEIANLHVPPELRHDPDVLTAQAVCQGLTGDWAGAFGIKLYREAFLRGVEKMNGHHLVMILVASPFFEHKNMLRMSPNGPVANLRDVEGSLLRGCMMYEHEQAVWLGSPMLEGSLLAAIHHRNTWTLGRCACCVPPVRPRHPATWPCAKAWPTVRPGKKPGRQFRFVHKGWWHPSGCPLPPPPGWAKRVMFDINSLPSEDAARA